MSSYGCNGFILQRNTIKSPLFKKSIKHFLSIKCSVHMRTHSPRKLNNKSFSFVLLFKNCVLLMCVEIKDRRTSGSGRHLSSQASSLSEGPQAAVNLCNTVLPCYISYHTHTQIHRVTHSHTQCNYIAGTFVGTKNLNIKTINDFMFI